MVRKKKRDLTISRVSFIANRVVFLQIILIILTLILSSIITASGISEFFFPFWYVFLLLIPICFIILAYIKRKIFYYGYHWISTLLLVLIPWLSITVYISIYVDYFLGYGKTLTVSLIVILLYLIGYTLARLIRSERVSSKFKKKARFWGERIRLNLFLIVVISSIILIVSTLTFGSITLNKSLKANNLESIYHEDYGDFRNCLDCIIAAFILFSGIGIFLSMSLNYAMLYELQNVKNWSVETDSPNRLIIICLKLTVIIFGICWIFAVFLFPPIPGTGKGGKKSSHVSGGHKISSTARTKGGYRKFDEIYNELTLIDKSWEKYDLIG